jgi:hypothetical protein
MYANSVDLSILFALHAKAAKYPRNRRIGKQLLSRGGQDARMSLADYTATRVFQSPFLRRSETISGGGAVIGALLTGPFYYWKKQAPVEALILFTIQLVLFVLSNRAIATGAIDSTTPSLVLWLGAALLAPVLLPMCYRRKGWIEVATI